MSHATDEDSRHSFLKLLHGHSVTVSRSLTPGLSSPLWLPVHSQRTILVPLATGTTLHHKPSLLNHLASTQVEPMPYSPLCLHHLAVSHHVG